MKTWTNKEIKDSVSIAIALRHGGCSNEQWVFANQLGEALSIVEHLQSKLKGIRTLCNPYHHRAECECGYCLIIKLIDGEL
jgi:hypothetical protein